LRRGATSEKKSAPKTREGNGGQQEVLANGEREGGKPPRKQESYDMAQDSVKKGWPHTCLRGGVS